MQLAGSQPAWSDDQEISALDEIGRNGEVLILLENLAGVHPH